MSYEPQGTTKPFIDAVRMEPQRVWSLAEAAQLMDVQQSRVGAWLEYAMRQKAVHRGRRNGQIVYSGTPFPPEAAFPLPAERNAQEWKPPQMIAPRAGSDVRHVNPPAPVSYAEINAKGRALTEADEIDPRFAAAHYGHDLHVGDRPGDGMVAAGPQTVVEEAAAPQPEEPPEEPTAEEEEAEEPDAWVSCRTGAIVVTGVPQEEDGSFILPADLVQSIKRQIAWSPAP